MHLQENPEASEEAVHGGKVRKHLWAGESGGAVAKWPCQLSVCLVHRSVRNVLEHNMLQE